jgi:replication factor C subunit 3/5
MLTSKKPWIEKYRPDKPKKILSHDKIKLALNNFLVNGLLPNLLLCGNAGLGKTSMILTYSKLFYGDDFNNSVLIINASEERGIETIRKKIEPFCKTSTINNISTIKFKLIIMDETDSMTVDAQSILRKVVEKYISNVRFCFICNYLKKINLSIQSRCTILKFKPIPLFILDKYIIKICYIENMKITQKAIDLIVIYCEGDLRKLLNILQSLNMNNYNNKKLIKRKDVSKLILFPSRKTILNYIKVSINNNFKECVDIIKQDIVINDFVLNEIINQFYDFITDNLIDENYNYFSKEKMIDILKNIMNINENLNNCFRDDVQLISFISVFYL